MGRGQGGKRGSGGYKECLVKVGWGKKQVETSRYNKKTNKNDKTRNR